MAAIGFILVGAAVMLVSVVKAGELEGALGYVRERQRVQIGRYLLAHRALMVVFLLGYLAVLAAFAGGYRALSETIVGGIFLLGAGFVYSGLALQARLLAETHQTIQGIVPICAQCKKIRGDGPAGGENWKSIENYISERAGVKFSHGYCPRCYQAALVDADRTAAAN